MGLRKWFDFEHHRPSGRGLILDSYVQLPNLWRNNLSRTVEDFPEIDSHVPPRRFTVSGLLSRRRRYAPKECLLVSDNIRTGQ